MKSRMELRTRWEKMQQSLEGRVVIGFSQTKVDREQAHADARATRVEEEGVEEEIRLAIGKQVAGRNVYYMTCSLVPFVMTWSGSLVTQFELDIAQRLFDPK